MKSINTNKIKTESKKTYSSRVAAHPQNQENVKITPQNSTDYVKSRRKFIQICDLQIANLDSNIIENYEKVTPILIFS